MKTHDTILHVARAIAVAALLAGGGCDEEKASSAPSQPVPSRRPAFAVSAPAPLPPVEKGPLRVEPGGYDFGRIPPDTTHDARFTLRNTGAAPVTIRRVTATCICTAPEDVADRQIEPGGTLSFSAGFNAPTETGDKSSQMILSFESGGQQFATQVRLRGTVTMAIQAEPTYIDALKLVTSGVVELSSIDGRPFSVLSSNGEAPVFVDGFAPESDAPRSTYRVAWHVPERSRSQCEDARLWWIIETDRPECPILPLRIRHECTGGLSDPDRMQRGWMFGEGIVPLGAIAAGEPVEVDVEVFNRGKVEITGVESLAPEATAELLSFSQGEGDDSLCRVRFTPAPSARGMLYAMVLFRSPTGNKDMAFVAKVEP